MVEGSELIRLHQFTRRRFLAATAGVGFSALSGIGSASARAPDDPVQTITTGLSGNVIAWSDPWSREGEGTPVAELPLMDRETDAAAGSHQYDAVTLMHHNRAIVELNFVPLPSYGVRWSLPSRWEGASNEVVLDEGGTPGGRYVFSFFAHDGVEYGRWSTILSPAYTATVDTRTLVAPVDQFGTSLVDLLAGITLNEAPVFERLNPAVLQRRLNPLVGTALTSAPEPDPAG